MRLEVTINDVDVIEMKAQHQPERVIIVAVIMYDNNIGMPVTVVLVTRSINMPGVVVAPMNIDVLVTAMFVMTLNIMRLVMHTMMTFATVITLIGLVFTMTMIVFISHRNRRYQCQAYSEQADQRQCFQSG